ncbi:MAG: endonuclease/exonuclease/phosphatase family protein [Chloroflexi bacterium]|nr:endonuclease/exonuclease/phosphatase family protein [Chloroflexota bacterium]
MRLATWNVERLGSQPRRGRILRMINEIAADVWIFTETDDSLVPAGMPSLHCADIDERRRSNERWVSIASKYPLEQLSLTGDPTRSVAARIHPSNREPFIVFGTVLPWTSDRWRGMRGSHGFAEALATQQGDLRRLRALEPHSDFVWAGDFNQHLGVGARYWSKRNGELLVGALEELGLHILTADPDPVTGVAGERRSVDHLCVARADLWDRRSLAVWPVGPAPDRQLSDHYGVAVDTVASRS